MTEFFQRLKPRKLMQWALAYIAAAFALLQGIDIVAQQFGWPDGIRRGTTLALVVGFFVTLVLERQCFGQPRAMGRIQRSVPTEYRTRLEFRYRTPMVCAQSISGGLPGRSDGRNEAGGGTRSFGSTHSRQLPRLSYGRALATR